MNKPATLYSNYSLNDNNNIFKVDPNELSIDSKEPHLKLKESFKRLGYDLATKDINKVEDSLFTIFYDMPRAINEISIPKNSYLILWECEVIAPENWIMKNHLKFKKIFTWDSSLVDNVKYFNFRYPNKLDFSNKPYKEKKLISMLAGNKYSNHPLELYSLRKKCIKWFETNNIDEIDANAILFVAFLTDINIRFRVVIHINNCNTQIPYTPAIFVVNNRIRGYKIGRIDNP